MNLLIVSDDAEFQRIVSGFTRGSGSQPLQRAQLSEALNNPPQVPLAAVLLDCIPPDGGIEALRQRLASCSAGRPEIVLVYEPSPRLSWNQLAACQADDYLAKPLSEFGWHLQMAAWQRRQARHPAKGPESGTTEAGEWTDRRLQLEIGERRRTEAALLSAIERFELAARGSQDGLWDATINDDDWLRPGAVELWWSERFCRLLGFRPEEFPPNLQAWIARLHPEDRQQVIQALQQHLDGRGRYDVRYRLLTKTGEYRWISARGQAEFDKQGRPTRMAGSVRDITEWVAAEEALRESEQRYRVLVEVNPDTVLVHRASKIMYINPSGVRLLGAQDRDEVLSRRFDEFVPEDCRQLLRAATERMCTDGPQEPYETCLLRFGGSRVPVEMVSGPVVYGGEQAILTIARDITERERAAAALVQEQQVLRRLLDSHERDRRLVAYEIHDGLIQYLTGAIMRLQALADLVPAESGDARDELELALHLARTALREGRRLLSGLRPPILDEAGLVAAVEYLVQEPHPSKPSADQPQVSYRHNVQFDRLTPLIESSVFRVFQEALTNARRYSQAQRIEVSLCQIGSWLHLDVRDDGVGFDPALVQQESFGLHSIRERVRLLGGHVVIRSRPSQGTHIHAEIPMASSDFESPADPSQQALTPEQPEVTPFPTSPAADEGPGTTLARDPTSELDHQGFVIDFFDEPISLDPPSSQSWDL